MTDVLSPAVLDARYAEFLRSPKADFVVFDAETSLVAQHGAASIPMNGWPGWPTGLASPEPVIETFVASSEAVVATSDNQPFVAAWTPLAAWMNTTVRSALAAVQVELSGDGYVTASLTATEALEGLAHLDDDQFMPLDSVSVVAIIGELAGPRVATGAAALPTLRPMAPLVFSEALLGGFANGELDHCVAAADELVVFPQFGQIHAGPAAHHVAHLAPTRQLLVLRASVALPGFGEPFE